MKRKLRKVLLSFMVLALLLVPKVEIHGATDFVISSVVTVPGTIQPNSDFTLTYVLTNTSGVDIFDISIQIDDTAFSYKNSGSVQNIGDIEGEPGDAVKTKSVTLNLTYNGDSSNKIPIKLSYLKGAGKVPTTQMDSITVNAVIDDGITPTPTDTSKYQPNLIINNTNVPIVYTGSQNTIAFELKNISSYSGTHITITPNITEVGTSKIRINQVNLDPKDVTINSQKSQVFSVVMLVDEGLTSGTYPISLSVTGFNAYGDIYTQTIIATINVIEDNPRVDIVKVSEQSQSIPSPQAGDTVALNFTILNDSMAAISNLEVWVDGLIGTQFGLTNKSSTFKLSTLKSAGNNKFTFTYGINSSTLSGSYPYKLMYQYYNSDGNLIKRETDYNLYISSGNSGTVEISNLVYPSDVLQEQDFNVTFNIKNTGSTELRNVKVALEENAVFLPTSTSIVSFSKLSIGGSQQVTFSLIGTGDSLKSRNYPLSFSVTYDGATTPIITEQTIGIYVDTSSDSSKSQPKIIIEKYESTPMIINAGTEFDLKLSFMNTHSSKTIKNIKAYLTVTEVGKETTGSVFTPVNSSNTFYIDSIAPKASVDREIKLYTIPDASPKTYTITVNFEYEDEQGNPLVATELVGINVKQPTKVDTSEFQLPTEGYVGQPIYIYFDVYNTGKVKVYNLMIKAEGNFMADPQSYYIGNFETGAQDYYEGNITPYEVGTLAGQFIISYDDSTGEHFEVVKDISINIMDMVPMEPYPGDGGMVDPGMPPAETGKKGPGLFIIIGIIVFVIAIAVTTIILLKRRKAKKEG